MFGYDLQGKRCLLRRLVVLSWDSRTATEVGRVSALCEEGVGRKIVLNCLPLSLSCHARSHRTERPGTWYPRLTIDVCQRNGHAMPCLQKAMAGEASRWLANVAGPLARATGRPREARANSLVSLVLEHEFDISVLHELFRPSEIILSTCLSLTRLQKKPLEQRRSHHES